MLGAQRYSATMAPRIMIMQQPRRSIANDIHHAFLTIFRLFTKPQSFACQFIALTVTVPAEAAISRLPDASGQPHAGESYRRPVPAILDLSSCRVFHLSCAPVQCSSGFNGRFRGILMDKPQQEAYHDLEKWLLNVKIYKI